MKTLITITTAFLFCITAVVQSHARIIQTVGSGSNINFDPSIIPSEYQQNYQTMTKKCAVCHGMDTIVVAVLTGKAPVTKQPFDREQAAGFGFRLMRMHNTGLKKEEIRDVTRLIQWLIDEKNAN